MTEGPIYFVHMSDTHFGPDTGYTRHGFNAYASAVRLVDHLNALPVKPDFIVHTGDVTTDPEPAAYALAAEVLGRLEAPVYYVTGNHDDAAMMTRTLRFGPYERLTEHGLCYRFDVGRERCLVLDGRGPDAIDPHGRLPAAQLAVVAAEVRDGTRPLTVFVHFPALPMNSPWMDDNMLLLNGTALHAALLPARDRLRGVFYGHIHQPMQTLRDGILYVSASSSFAQFAAWPNDFTVRQDPDALPGFGFVHMLPDQTIIHQHTLPR